MSEAPTGKELPVINEDALQAIVEMFGDDDPEAIVELLDTFLSESAIQVRTMQTSLASGDMESLHRMAHSLKSSSATFGAGRLSSQCAQLERLAKDGCQGDCEAVVHQIVAEHDQACIVLRDLRTAYAQ
ncbi:MAG: Hpt domain-containing protein [Caldilineaceae bacterium]|nr:Hpt domain-containing protein [Caldilineaceae bacterium]